MSVYNAKLSGLELMVISFVPGFLIYRTLGRARRDPLSSFAPGGGKMRDPGNEVGWSYHKHKYKTSKLTAG